MLDAVDVGAWQEQLDRNFLSHDEGHLALLRVLGSEADYAVKATEQLRGHHALLHSLQAFTLHSMFEGSRQVGTLALKGKQSYIPFLFEFVLAFRTLRACENVNFAGYPHTAYGLLRGLRDRAFFLAAMGLGHTTIQALWGLLPNMTEAEMEAAKDIWRRAREEEERVLNLVLRKATDLGANHDPLLRWDRMFNPEIHGDKYSGAQLFSPWIEGGLIPVYPQYDPEFGAAYVNRAGDLGWMLMRLLPLLQAQPLAFGQTWADRWAILDDSFRAYNRGLTTIGKPGLAEIADGIEALVDLRFDFHPATSSYQTYRE